MSSLYHGTASARFCKGNLADIDFFFFFLLVVNVLVYAEYFKEPEP